MIYSGIINTYNYKYIIAIRTVMNSEIILLIIFAMMTALPIVGTVAYTVVTVQEASAVGTCPTTSSCIYVVDTNNTRIQKFDSNGNFITKWGTKGTGDGEFLHPHDVVLDSSGYVYVTDAFNYNIQKFDSNGNFITKWGSNGTGDTQFLHIYGIGVSS